MYGILLQQLFFVAAVVYSGSLDFLYGRCKQLFVNELNNAYFSRHCFADIIVSQGSVATYATCGGIVNVHLTANLPRNLSVKFF